MNGPVRPQPGGRLVLLVVGAAIGLVVGIIAGKTWQDERVETVRGVVTNVAEDGRSLCIGRSATATEGPCARPALTTGQRLPQEGDQVEAQLVTVLGEDGGPGFTVFVFSEGHNP